MRHTVRSMSGEPVLARDGRIGALDDVYFDERGLAVRYLVVDAEDWLPGRRLLVAPEALAEQVNGKESLHLSLTREELLLGPRGTDDPEAPRPMRSGAELIGYGVETRERTLGVVVDVVVDENCSAVDGVMVDPLDGRAPWLLGLEPRSVLAIEPDERRILVQQKSSGKQGRTRQPAAREGQGHE